MKRESRYILGIDEAGRGCVLGPLVVAGVLFEDRADIFDILHSYNIRDSKLLTVEKRAALCRVVRRLKHKSLALRIAPSRIDEESLNVLEIEHSVRIIGKLRPHTVYLYVPATGAGIANYCNAIKSRCGIAEIEILGGNNYDGINLVVAAASIVAKEVREAEVRKLHKSYGDFGSGYAHDPRTRAWLTSWKQSQKKWPAMVRTKWETVARMSV